MVEYVIASEFDNKLGTYIKETHPQQFDHSCDLILADYMIPDGMHRNEKDMLVFKSILPVKESLISQEIEELNSSSMYVNLYQVIGNNKEVYDDAEAIEPNSELFDPKLTNFRNFGNTVHEGQHPGQSGHSNGSNYNAVAQHLQGMDYKQVLAHLDKNQYSGVWQNNSMRFKFQIIKMKFLMMSYMFEGKVKEKYIILHDNIHCKKIEGTVYSLRAEDDAIYLIEFQDKETAEKVCEMINLLQENQRLRKAMDFTTQEGKEPVFLKRGWFFCMVSNRKDSSIERGSLYRSVAIFSSKINIFEPFKELLEDGLRRYSELPAAGAWNDTHTSILQHILSDIFKQSQEILEFNSFRTLTISNNFNYTNKEFKRVVKTRTPAGIQSRPVRLNLMNGSIPSLISFLKVNIMHLYRALFEERSIVFYGEKAKAQRLCEIVTSCLILLKPLNLIDKIHPVEHIQSLRLFKNRRGWIVGFTNPIVKNRKSLQWDLMIDVNSGKIYNPEMKTQTKDHLLPNDKVFGKKLLEKIMNDNLSEDDITNLFQQYTKNNIEMMLNRTNKLDYDQENDETINKIFQQSDNFKKTSFFTFIDLYYKNERESFRQVFGSSYLPIFQAYNYLTEAQKHDGIELLIAYSTISGAFNIQENDNSTSKTGSIMYGGGGIRDSTLIQMSKGGDTEELKIIKDLRISFFLSLVKQRTGNLDCLILGLMSDEKEVYEANGKMIGCIDRHAAWLKYLSGTSLFKVLLINDAVGHR